MTPNDNLNARDEMLAHVAYIESLTGKSITELFDEKWPEIQARLGLSDDDE